MKDKVNWRRHIIRFLSFGEPDQFDKVYYHEMAALICPDIKMTFTNWPTVDVEGYLPLNLISNVLIKYTAKHVHDREGT